tara:strand:- start:19065 stop:19934 length:870 start_codon:yes stop_codon:yes gene_type:complete
MTYISSLADAPAPALRAQFETIIADALKSVSGKFDLAHGAAADRAKTIGSLKHSCAVHEGLALEHAARAVLGATGTFVVLPRGIRFPLPQAALRHAHSDEAPRQFNVCRGDRHAAKYRPDLIAVTEFGELVIAEIKRDASNCSNALLQDVMTRLKASAMVAESVLRQNGFAVDLGQVFVAIVDATGTSNHADVLDFEGFGEAIDEPDFPRDMRYFRAAFDIAADTIAARYSDRNRTSVRPVSSIDRFKTPLHAPFAIARNAQHFHAPLYAPFKIRTRAEPRVAVGGPRV